MTSLCRRRCKFATLITCFHMSEPNPKRRWFRYSLRTLFVLLTILCAYLAWQVRIVQQRKQLLAKIEAATGPRFQPLNTTAQEDAIFVLGGPIQFPDQRRGSFIRRLFRDRTVPIICLPSTLSADDLAMYKNVFPEAVVTQYSDSSGEMHLTPAAGRHFEVQGDSWTIK